VAVLAEQMERLQAAAREALDEPSMSWSPGCGPDPTARPPERARPIARSRGTAGVGASSYVHPVNAPAILLVEDDNALAGLLERALSVEGYDVTAAGDGHTGLHLALTRRFDVMVVDRGLPAIEGLDLIARLRSSGVTCPVLVLSARGTTRDRIDGLDAGAEDYLAKPFDLDELVARLRALLRRHADRAVLLRVPHGRLDVATRTVHRDDGDVTLSQRETALLALLASRPQQVFSRRDLLQRVFDDAESETVVDTYVHYCRRKLGRDVISTVRGLGFRLGAA
jgi:two-component system response regulator QseB